MLSKLANVLVYTLSCIIPKKKNRWIFGSWFGTSASDNPKGLFDYMKTVYPDVEKVWIVNEPENYNGNAALFVKRNTWKSVWYILTAKVAVMNQGYRDFHSLNLLGGCYKVQLWHGIAWKKIVRDAAPMRGKLYTAFSNYINHCHLYIAPSETYAKTVQSAFGVPKERVLLCGQPRNDALFDEKFCEDSHQKLLDCVGEKNKKIIVYMPTFRDKTSEAFTFCNEDVVAKLVPFAEKHNFVIIEKSHFVNIERSQRYENTHRQISYVLPTMDAQTLLAGADMLITDYSSCFFDFLIRNKPIIHYAYDYDYYKNKDRGLYYTIDEVAAGSVAYDESELLYAIDENMKDEALFEERRKEILEKFAAYESPKNSRVIVDEIMRRLGD